KAAIEFYKKVFGAKHLYSLTMPNGAVAHGEFKIGETLIMISDESPEWGSKSPATLGGSPVTLNVMVDNPDAVAEKAVKAGGKLVFPVSDQFYGFRSGRIEDPFGHYWIVSKVLEELTPSEMQRRMDEWMASMSKDQPAAKAKPETAGKAKAKAASPKAKDVKK
ncbi:MAG: VOC family protein, partial [Rhodomicrobium sp.]